MKNLLLVLLFFSIGIILGLTLPDEQLRTQVIENLNQIGESENLFWRIFLQNTLIATILLFGGYIFAIPTLYLIVLNGYVISMVTHYFMKLHGNNLIFALVPHGIFEFAAFGYAAVIGFEKSVAFFSMTKKRNILKSYLIIIVLLLVAATIEIKLING